jgi:hypothetical protein
MRFKIITCLAACLFLLTIATGAVKSKKASSIKASKEAAELKEKITSLEAQKVSLTARVAILEKELNTSKKSSKTTFLISIASGGAALIMALFMLAGTLGKNSPETEGKKSGKKDTGAPAGREKHYEDIEYHVLNDWQNIWFHPENIDPKLYDDLKNHFPELHADMEEWKGSMNSRQLLSVKLGAELEKDHPSVETMPCIYMLSFDNETLFIEGDEIKAGTYVCARSKQGLVAGKDVMKAYYDDCMNMLAKKPYSDMKGLSADMSGLKNGIDLKIRKIKFTKDLPGDCGYLRP